MLMGKQYFGNCCIEIDTALVKYFDLIIEREGIGVYIYSRDFGKEVVVYDLRDDKDRIYENVERIKLVSGKGIQIKYNEGVLVVYMSEGIFDYRVKTQVGEQWVNPFKDPYYWGTYVDGMSILWRAYVSQEEADVVGMYIGIKHQKMRNCTNASCKQCNE